MARCSSSAARRCMREPREHWRSSTSVASTRSSSSWPITSVGATTPRRRSTIRSWRARRRSGAGRMSKRLPISGWPSLAANTFRIARRIRCVESMPSSGKARYGSRSVSIWSSSSSSRRSGHSSSAPRTRPAVPHGTTGPASCKASPEVVLRSLSHIAPRPPRSPKVVGCSSSALLPNPALLRSMCSPASSIAAAANALGRWERALGYCHRALAHGMAVDDLRLKVSALLRMGLTHIQQGEVAAGLRRCEEAQSLSPTPYDAAALRGIRAYGLIKQGHLVDGIAELKDVLDWYARSNLRFTRSQFMLWLGEAYLRKGDRELAKSVCEDVLA